jgi:hypothetical protein
MVQKEDLGLKIKAVYIHVEDDHRHDSARQPGWLIQLNRGFGLAPRVPEKAAGAPLGFEPASHQRAISVGEAREHRDDLFKCRIIRISRRSKRERGGEFGTAASKICSSVGISILGKWDAAKVTGRCKGDNAAKVFAASVAASAAAGS